MNGVCLMSRAPGLSLLLLLLVPLSQAGCSWMQPRNWGTLPDAMNIFGTSGGTLSVTSTADAEETLQGQFQSGIYSSGDPNSATMILYDGPADNPAAAVTIRMFWSPDAGRTPIDATATNATIQYIIFDGNGIGIAIYSGAGYFYPNSSVGNDKFTGSVWQSSLRLTDKSEGYEDKLGQAQLKGKFTVNRDDLAIDEALHKLNVQVRERLGRTRLVHEAMPTVRTARIDRE